jgi:hypothetical protein
MTDLTLWTGTPGKIRAIGLERAGRALRQTVMLCSPGLGPNYHLRGTTLVECQCCQEPFRETDDFAVLRGLLSNSNRQPPARKYDSMRSGLAPALLVVVMAVGSLAAAGTSSARGPSGWNSVAVQYETIDNNGKIRSFGDGELRQLLPRISAARGVPCDLGTQSPASCLEKIVLERYAQITRTYESALKDAQAILSGMLVSGSATDIPARARQSAIPLPDFANDPISLDRYKAIATLPLSSSWTLSSVPFVWRDALVRIRDPRLTVHTAGATQADETETSVEVECYAAGTRRALTTITERHGEAQATISHPYKPTEVLSRFPGAIRYSISGFGILQDNQLELIILDKATAAKLPVTNDTSFSHRPGPAGIFYKSLSRRVLDLQSLLEAR